MRVFIFGAGNIGAALLEKLKREYSFEIFIARRSGLYNQNLEKIGKINDWEQLAEKCKLAFLCIPSSGTGQDARQYASYFLSRGRPVVSCEKVALAYFWDDLKRYKDKLKYSAAVGGGTRMVKFLVDYNADDIYSIKAVVNGTLNFISTAMLAGKSQDQIVDEVLAKGLAEPGASTFDRIINSELNDVSLKAAILANHSGLFKNTIKPTDITVQNFDAKKRCIVHVTSEKISAGYIEELNSPWLPEGENNVLLINDKKIVEGPGAGSEPTVAAMLKDLEELQSLENFEENNSPLSFKKIRHSFLRSK